MRDGQVYFAASIWPFMGVFIYALDATTGQVIWVNDDSGSQYIKQPHSAPSFAGVAPQGALVATQDILLVPGGRSVPAAFDRHTGAFRYFEINAAGKGTGGSLVIADEESYYVHTRHKGTREFNLVTGIKTAFLPNEPVLTPERIYSAETEKDACFVRAYDRKKEIAWQLACDGHGDLILAGNRLYAAGKNTLTAIELPRDGQPASIAWQIPTDIQIERLLAADGKLFAVTLDGRIMAFGQSTTNEPKSWREETTEFTVTAAGKATAADLLQATDAQGYALWIGDCEHEVLDAFAASDRFVQLATIDSNRERVDRKRAKLQQSGRYGRVTVHHSQPGQFAAPAYVAHIICIEQSAVMEVLDNPKLAATVYASVRPYGGVMHLLTSHDDRREIANRVESLKLEQAQVAVGPHGVMIRRVGALPGSGDWTHQYGDVANTVKSNDSRVKLPLGILWFGGNSNADVLPRHGHGPPEQVIGGRLFIEGMNSLSCRDVYTGRVFWKRDFPKLGTHGVYFDDTYRDSPLDPAYNQVHIPGANGRGTNYVATADRVYIVEGSVCHVLDPATGATMLDIPLPQVDAHNPRAWGYIGVYQDVLVGGLGFANFRSRHEISTDTPATSAEAKKAVFGISSLDHSASLGLVGFDRHTGKQLWQVDARHSFWHNGIVAGGGRIYALDKNPQQVEDVLKRRGKALPDTYRIVAIDHLNGQTIWEHREAVFGTWLSYSEKHDLLLQSGAAASDRLAAEVGQGIAVHRGRDGSIQWKKEALKYSGPCILHNETIITNANSYSESAGAFSLINGSMRLITNPITGQTQPWRITRTYGCNNIIASENLLTFRSGAAGFYDLLSHSGTGNLGGFKSGCTSNLVVAGGVLNAPDYTRTCSCAYQNQTSLALVPMPELDIWAVNGSSKLTGTNDRVEKLGVNFGAPGDRSDDAGLLWIEFPETSGAEAPISIEVDGDVTYFQNHSTANSEGELPWVRSSGVEGVKAIRVGFRKPVSKDSSVGQAERPLADVDEKPFRLRMFFAHPAGQKPQRRIFDVSVQGKTVFENVTIDSEGSTSLSEMIKTVDPVMIGGELSIEFAEKVGKPVICGIELRRQEPKD